VAIFVICGMPVFAQSTALNQRKPVIADQDLVIEVADITENALFYPVDIDGTRLEIIAVRAPDGTIRTAFNNCLVCYSSGKGYFEQVDTLLVCQNCGARFRMSQLERRAEGMNPEPIFPEYKIETDTTITILKEYFRRFRRILDGTQTEAVQYIDHDH
jgi:hypothetical protein